MPLLPTPYPRLPWEGQEPHRAAAQMLQPQLVGQLAHGHGVGHVLLVGKHQQHRIPQLVLLQLTEVKGMESGVLAESPGLPFPAVEGNPPFYLLAYSWETCNIV